jgi:hypothetical protein
MTKELTKAKLEANRANASKSTGPSITFSTRYNAVKHGLLADGITELDGLEYKNFLAEVKAGFNPEGPIEKFLTERICLCMVRLKRAIRLEAEFITEALNPPFTRTEGGLDYDFDDFKGTTVVVDPGLPAPLPECAVERIAGSFQRYETALENKLYRAMNQLERLQRMRKGETIPAPVTLGVGFNGVEQHLGSFGNQPA